MVFIFIIYPNPFFQQNIIYIIILGSLLVAVLLYYPIFKKNQHQSKTINKIPKTRKTRTPRQIKRTKTCRVCGKQFKPEKSYYHTCPKCFKY